MSNPFTLPNQAFPSAFFLPENRSLFTGIMRGLEKESLRVLENGTLARTPHPTKLGSALTHPQITTDFSEALLEFITPPSHHIPVLMEQLQQIHQFTFQHLPADEMLWNNSMPCMIGEEKDIPVAQYGTTNRAKMKSIYRVGLGHRYGRTMQTVAGVHFNFSLPNSFWAFMLQHENSPEDLDEFKTRRYFDLIRNFRRHYWLLIYLFGASPAICRSFVKSREHNLEILDNDDHTLHLPYATSLRMGDLGYQSKAQESLYVCYNTQESYIKTLASAISTSYPDYLAIGTLNSNQQYNQLNCNLLQIENEFYSSIRPKRTAQKGETALTALCRRGVEYIEVRCLDIDPFSELGISSDAMHFMDIFLVYCALQDSPLCDKQEFLNVLENQKRVVKEGRRPNLTLTQPSGEQTGLKTWANQLLESLNPIAELLDHCYETQQYSNALNEQKIKAENPQATPSAKVLNTLKEGNITFAQWAKNNALSLKSRFLSTPLSADHEKRMHDMSVESIALQQAEEEQQQIPFSDYLKEYYEQYEACCAEKPDTTILRAKKLLLD